MAAQFGSKPVPHIVIVDDDPVQVAIIRGVCAKLGFETRFAASYQEAVDQISTGHFDCVTIDLSLGDRDGIELLRLIAAEAKVPRIIVISGCDERILNATVRMAHGAGITDAISLPKPINLSFLREALTLHTRGQASPLADANAATRQITAADLRRAIDFGELSAAFQPKVDLASGEVIGCEALARWDSQSFGSVIPDVFIPLAEASGLIKSLTERVLRGALLMSDALLKIDPTFVVAVNLSATMLSDAALPEEIERLLAETETPARSLMIEVTESTAMADVSQAMDILLRLRIKGMGISIDDFGMGYSSLSALARMPFSELKIDRSFVKDCLTDSDMWKIVSSSVVMAHQYHMKVVAEGIENVETWRALVALGCDIGQGFVFSRALNHDDFIGWYRDWIGCRTGSPGQLAQRATN